MRTPEQVKCFLKEAMENNFGMELARGHKGAIIGLLNKLLGVNNRYILLGWLFNNEVPMSSKDLTELQWLALSAWVDNQEVAGVWLPQKDFEDEVISCIMEATGIVKRMVEEKPYRFD